MTEIDDGLRAKRFMESPAFQKAVERVEAAYLKAWKSSDPHDKDGREKLHDRYTALQDVIKALDAAVVIGQRKEKELNG